MIYGMDYLGGAKYPDTILKNHPRGWAIGIFARAFGDAFPIVKKLADSGRCPLIRIQLVWDGTHLYGDKWLPTAIREARRYEKLCGHSRIQLSPFCEHNHKDPDKYLDAVRSVAPSCEIINTPYQGRFSSRYRNETHTISNIPLAQQFSFDGRDALAGGGRAALELARAVPDVVFLWTARFNGKMSADDKTPIANRRAWPDAKTIMALRRMVNG